MRWMRPAKVLGSSKEKPDDRSAVSNSSIARSFESRAEGRQADAEVSVCHLQKEKPDDSGAVSNSITQLKGNKKTAALSVCRQVAHLHGLVALVHIAALLQLTLCAQRNRPSGQRHNPGGSAGTHLTPQLPSQAA